MSKSVHTIHVPHGWTPEQTWECISRDERVPERAGDWVNIEVADLTTRPCPAPGMPMRECITGGRLVRVHD